MIESLIKLMVVAGLIGANADKIELFYDEIVSMTQHIATAGDIRSITTMLDYTYVKKGRYPETERFASWMEMHFKENQVKSLTKDHWGNELIYESSKDRKRFSLISRGADGALGTDDDMKLTAP